MMKNRNILLCCKHVCVCLMLFFFANPLEAQDVVYRYTHMGNKSFRAENVDKAEQYYLKVTKKNSNNTRALFNLADVYLAKGNVKVADSLFNHVAQQDGSRQVRAMAWHNRGYISQTAALKSRDQQQHLLQAAIEHYKQSLRYNPLDNRTRYNLALCQKQLKSMPPQPNNKQQPKSNNKQQEKKQQDNKQQENNKQQNKQQNNQQQERQQTEQYINLAKQAEQRALQKLKQRQPAKRSLEKNW